MSFSYDPPMMGYEPPPELERGYVVPGVVKLTGIDEDGRPASVEVFALTIGGELFIVDDSEFLSILAGMHASFFDRCPEADIEEATEGMVDVVRKAAEVAHSEDDPGWTL